MVVAGDATARNSYVTYLSGKLPNVSQSPYITQIMVGGRKPGEGGKCVVVAVAVGSFTNLGHRRREGETEEEEECRARTGKASSGRRQKRWEKSQWQSVSRRRPFSKGILESATRGPWLRLLRRISNSYFSGGSRMSKPNLSRFELPLSQKRFPGAAPSLLLLSGE